MRSNSTSAEDTSAQQVKSFTSSGFVQGTDVPNTSGETGVYWAWDAGANSSKTYTVTVVSDSGNKYRFDGHGTSAVTLNLEEGSTYVFDQSDSSNSGHPLRFSTTSDGTHGGGSIYSDGVTIVGTQGQSGAYLQIVVATDGSCKSNDWYWQKRTRADSGQSTNTQDQEVILSAISFPSVNRSYASAPQPCIKIIL